MPGQPKTDQGALVHETAADYLRIQRARLVAGRALESADVDAVRRVGVVNRDFARRFFGGASPIGRTVRLDYLARPPLELTDNGFEIVGVIDDLRNQGPARDPAPEIYVPFGINGAFAYLIVETRMPPQRLERTVRAEVYALDPQQPVTDVRALDAVIDEEVFARPVSACCCSASSPESACCSPSSASTASWPTPSRSSGPNSACAWRSAPRAPTCCGWCWDGACA